MQRHFDDELNQLKEKILRMGALVEKMVYTAVQGIVERNKDLFLPLTDWEKEVNQLHIEVDEACITLLALYQPTAVDLRFITAGMKINAELERIGDQAMNISQTGGMYINEPPLNLDTDFKQMADIAISMLKDGLDSFVRKDTDLAFKVLERDSMVDELKRHGFRELLTLMAKDTGMISRGIDLILISRNLERVGDHATNVAEDVIFMVLGKDVRHHAKNGNIV